MRIGYHASHEQFSPRELLEYVQLAEEAGFHSVLSSEHIAPWSVRQGQSGFSWAWLGAALASTKKISFGALAIPIGLRYHPVVAAHAFATLSQMFPERFPWIAAGTGEALNECMVGMGWPDKDERTARLVEAVEIMRALWRGDVVSRETSIIRTHEARLWSRPEKPPHIFAAALSRETAAQAGVWADGLITVRYDLPDLQPIVKAFRENGGANKPLILQLQLSWAPTKAQARENAHDQWRHVALDISHDEVRTPEAFDAACAHVAVDEMDKSLPICSTAEEVAECISTYQKLGFDEIYLHNAGRNQREFISFFGREVRPRLEGLAPCH